MVRHGRLRKQSQGPQLLPPHQELSQARPESITLYESDVCHDTSGPLGSQLVEFLTRAHNPPRSLISAAISPISKTVRYRHLECGARWRHHALWPAAAQIFQEGDLADEWGAVGPNEGLAPASGFLNGPRERIPLGQFDAEMVEQFQVLRAFDAFGEQGYAFVLAPGGGFCEIESTHGVVIEPN